MPDSVSQDDVSTLVERLEDAAWAYMRGDMERYLELVHHARGFTLLAPGGGPPVSYENRADGVRASVGFFKGGESRLENVEVHAWDDTVVVALIERTRIGRCGLLRSFDAWTQDGSWCIATPTRWSIHSHLSSQLP
jgi:hypothetical protein